MQVWSQNYNPLGNTWLSTLMAALPVTLLFYLLAVRKVAAHRAAAWAFICGTVLALVGFQMPATMVAVSVGYGFVDACIRIFWTLVAAVFVYDLTVESGHFETINASIGRVTEDRRLQALLIALAFGAVLEGAGGGGAPLAICGAMMMMGLGFRLFTTAVMWLLANTAPVAFGAMGHPIPTLQAVTGVPEADLSAMVGRIVRIAAAILPLWMVRTMTGWRNATVWRLRLSLLAISEMICLRFETRYRAVWMPFWVSP
jgi:lactate permease